MKKKSPRQAVVSHKEFVEEKRILTKKIRYKLACGHLVTRPYSSTPSTMLACKECSVKAQ